MVAIGRGEDGSHRMRMFGLGGAVVLSVLLLHTWMQSKTGGFSISAIIPGDETGQATTSTGTSTQTNECVDASGAFNHAPEDFPQPGDVYLSQNAREAIADQQRYIKDLKESFSYVDCSEHDAIRADLEQHRQKVRELRTNTNVIPMRPLEY